MSYNYVENYSFDRSGTRIRPAWKGLGLATGGATAGSLASETGISLTAAQKIMDKLFASAAGKELEQTLAEMFTKYVPADKQASVQAWIVQSGLSVPFIPKPETAEAGRADVTSEPVTPKESKMKMLIPIALVGIGAFLMMRKR